MSSASLVLVIEAPGISDGLAHGAAVAVAAARGGLPAPLLVSLETEPRRRSPTLLASPEARELEGDLREAGMEGAVARGRLCHLALPAGAEGLPALAGLNEAVGSRPVVTVVPAEVWADALELGPHGALLRARLPRDRPLAA